MHRIFNQLAWVKSSTPEKVPPPAAPVSDAALPVSRPSGRRTLRPASVTRVARRRRGAARVSGVRTALVRRRGERACARRARVGEGGTSAWSIILYQGPAVERLMHDPGSTLARHTPLLCAAARSFVVQEDVGGAGAAYVMPFPFSFSRLARVGKET